MLTVSLQYHLVGYYYHVEALTIYSTTKLFHAKKCTELVLVECYYNPAAPVCQFTPGLDFINFAA